MSRKRFGKILSTIRYNDIEDAKHNNWLFPIIQMEEARKEKIDNEFNLEQINGLSKSMMEWFNNYDPRFIYVGNKYNTFGN